MTKGQQTISVLPNSYNVLDLLYDIMIKLQSINAQMFFQCTK